MTAEGTGSVGRAAGEDAVGLEAARVGPVDYLPAHRESASTDPPWGDVTLALVFPYHLDWRKEPLTSQTPAPSVSLRGRAGTETRFTGGLRDDLGILRRAWDPFALNPDSRSAGDAPRMTVRDTAYQHWFSPTNYFHSDYLAERVVAGAEPNLYEAWVPGGEGAAGLPPRLTEIAQGLVLDDDPSAVKRVEVLGAERHEFPPVTLGVDDGIAGGASRQTIADPGHGFAVIHLKIVGFTSDELTRASEYLLKPSSWTQGEGTARTRHGLSLAFTRILHGIGLHVEATRGGFTNGCFRRSTSGPGHYANCRKDARDPYAPTRHTVAASGWREDRLRERHLGGGVGPVDVHLEIGHLGDAAALPWDPAGDRSPGRLPKAHNRVTGLWCLPDDGQTRPQPYNLFHLDGSEHWTAHRPWTYQLAHGHRMSGTYSLPDDSEAEADRGYFHGMGCDIRVTPTGLAVVLDAGLSDSRREFGRLKDRARTLGRRLGDFDSVESYVSDAVVRSVVHGRFVDLTLLVIRQRFLLSSHMAALARLHESSTDRGPDAADAPSAIHLEQWFQWFINQRWFDEIPGRPEATQVLQELQEVTGTAGDLRRVREEQEGLFRMATFKAELERERFRERQDEDKAQEQAKRNATRETFETLAAVFAPPALVFSAAAVLTDPNPVMFWASVVISLLLVGITTYCLWCRRTWFDYEASRTDSPRENRLRRWTRRAPHAAGAPR